MKITKLHNEEFKDKKLTKANKHLFGITNSNKRDEILFDKFTNADEYEQAADRLALQKVTTSNPGSNDNVIGFISKSSYIKYDKINNEIVSYISNDEMKTGNQLITYFKPARGLDYYKDLLDNYYMSEIK